MHKNVFCYIYTIVYNYNTYFNNITHTIHTQFDNYINFVKYGYANGLKPN